MSYHAAAFLVELDGLEQRLKVPLAEALVALALNHFEEDRTDGVFGENLQQNAGIGAAVDQDAPPRKLLQRLLVVRHTSVDAFIVGVGRILELDAPSAQSVHRACD